MSNHFERLRVVDSHTGGEPTRIIVSGTPPPPAGSMADRLEWFRREHDSLRKALVNEPRGSDVMVGGALFEPADQTCAAGVLYFNNVGYLGMCVHGTIGLMVTLGYLGKIKPGEHRIETPVGIVTATLHNDAQVTVQNVPSYRSATNVEVDVSGYGKVRGDVAWGGNWFFLVNKHPIELSMANVEKLTEFAWAVRMALQREKVTGADGAEIDHIELYGASKIAGVNSKGFVLCPGKAYDRSPCGTGTSAKLACLYADGKLKPGETWRQESIVGSIFEGTIRVNNGYVLPSIKGSAFITADANILVDPHDPFRFGIP
ncbi:MAG TPA: proline racemase family protein [Candidatus Acidoferrales bacterium]|nr:proline racemase family protein [Candidatus Acidoferrales bacterium]